MTSPTRLRVADLPEDRPTPFRLVPGRDALRALAAELGLDDLRKLRFEGRVAPVGTDRWRLDAHLGATVVQPCVVTLAPVTTRIEETVTRRFLPTLPDDTANGEDVEMPEDETIDRLEPEIDLEAVMAEALALALPLYPRADGAELVRSGFTEPGKTPLSDEDLRPFSGLKALRGRIEGND